MELITERDLIRSVASRWRRQYNGRMNEALTRGQTPEQIAQELDRLDVEVATAEDVIRIVGNDTWTCPPRCSECHSVRRAVIRIGEEPDRESETAWLCQDCAAKIAQVQWPPDETGTVP
jgi:hypothetical protein